MDTNQQTSIAQHAGRPRLSAWRVLARLPDVAASSTTSPTHEATAPSSAVARRIDPPQGIAAQRSARTERRKAPPRVESNILPSKDPFSFQQSTWFQVQSSLVRFILMVVLFTVAGTIIVMSKSSKQPAASTPRSNTALRPSFERSASALEPIDSTPTVKGPSQTTRSIAAEPSAATLGPALLEAPAAGEAGTTNTPTPAGQGATDSEELTGRGATQPSTRVAPPLPQLQVTAPPPATAHLSGFILEAPSQQASHDGDEQSIY